MLLPLEELFVKFVSEQNTQSLENTREAYLKLKTHFDFSSKEYRKFCEDVHLIYEIFYLNPDELKLIEAYKNLGFVHMFRHLSYAFPVKESFLIKLKKFIKSLIKYRLTDRYPSESLLEILSKQKWKMPIVVDYGAGLGCLSFKIGQKFNNSKIYLADIDSIIIRFAEYYFKEEKIDVSIIKIDANNLYPILPDCNVSICNEVLEHVRDPCLVLNNILRALQSGGLLYGNFEDHLDEFLHVSTNLVDIRIELAKHFNKIDNCIYRKK